MILVTTTEIVIKHWDELKEKIRYWQWSLSNSSHLRQLLRVVFVNNPPRVDGNSVALNEQFYWQWSLSNSSFWDKFCKVSLWITHLASTETQVHTMSNLRGPGRFSSWQNTILNNGYVSFADTKAFGGTCMWRWSIFIISFVTLPEKKRVTWYNVTRNMKRK